jgi:Restriction endonuclease
LSVEFIRSKKYHIFRRSRYYNAHPKSKFQVKILPGVLAQFGESKGRYRSCQYHLLQLSFDKNLYAEEVADVFWRRFNILHINRKRRGKKIPRIYRVVGGSQKTFYGGYVVICEPILPSREAFVKQNSYEYWSDQFYLNGGIYANLVDQKEALALLLNKISTNSAILHDIPTKTDWRVFEEIVAEIFRKFGYEIELTKRTRDGGKDIIALRKNGDKVTERLLIECKHWQSKIDVNPIRNLVGVAVTQDELPTGIILATTSTFTEDAKELKINPAISIELDLKDYNDVLNWIGDYNAIQLTPVEIEQYLCEH